MSDCAYPGCEWTGNPRPYGRKRDMPSVTAVTGMLDDGKARSFGWAAAGIAATTAVHHADLWAELGTEDCTHDKTGFCPACRYIRSEFDRQWSAKAARGNHVHHLACSWAQGEPVDVDDECAPYMDALERFYVDCCPEFHLLEQTVLYSEPKSHAYRGSFDFVATLTRGGERRKGLWDIKGLALDTPLPTPTGWTTIAAVQVGDQVIGSDGKPCTVRRKSEIRDRPCYRLTFDDGSSPIVCDDEHRWAVQSGPAKGLKAEVMTTTELVDNLYGHNGQRHLRIVNASPLHLPDADLPIDPYVLGCWLGDGHHTRGVITKPDDELFGNIASRGWQVGEPYKTNREGECRSSTVFGLQAALRKVGLLGNKHVPDVYLRGSYQQRLDLLRGLMDTDGTYHRTRHSAVFVSCDKKLSASVYELVVSLGWRASQDSHPATGFGLTVTAHSVTFVPHDANPFWLTRKAELVRVGGTAISRRRLIISVERTVDVPTQCISVDSPDNTYLCGEQMVPTHNTGSYRPVEQTLQLAAYRGAKHLTDWSDGTEKVVGKMPAVAEAGVLLLGDDGEYRLIELPANGDAHGTFLRQRDTWGFVKKMQKWAKENPDGAPATTTTTQEEAA